MLNQNQLRRLQASDRWLKEIRDSKEFQQAGSVLDAVDAAFLNDAIIALSIVVDRQESYYYKSDKPANFTDQEWQDYQDFATESDLMCIDAGEVEINKPKQEKIKDFITNAAGNIAGIAMLSASFMLVSSIFCRGIDRIEESKGENYDPAWVQRAKACEGGAIAAFSVFLGANLTAVCCRINKV